MAVYTYIQQSTFLQQLANRLYDPTEQFWSHAEKTLYLQEALRTWNALTAFWRQDFNFSTQQGVIFYDLTDTAAMPLTLRALTLHDTDVYTVCQYHLLEPPTGVNPWTGVSTQFTADDLINAVQRRRDEILSISGCTVTRRLVAAVPGRIQLPDTAIDIRRVAYFPSSGIPSVVWPDDVWGEQTFNRGYLQKPPGTPFTFLQNAQPPISFDVDKTPGAGGNYEVLTVDAGPALIVNTPQTMSVPDDWLWAVKWGALADLLSRDSNAKDLPRAQYAEQRYRMATALLTDAPALLFARIGNVPIQIDAIKNADLYRTSWQGLAQASPDTLYVSGLNKLACAPPPSAGPFSLTLTVVQNAPMPANDADSVQVAREDLDAILDYCVHIAFFKIGGKEFMDTTPLLERFIKQAALYNSKLDEWGEFSKILKEVSPLEEDYNPRTLPQETTS